MITHLDPQRNQLLAALPDAEWRRWVAQLEWVDLPLGQVICESGSKMSHVYFATTAIVSLLYVMENGASAEIAVVGSEGIVGISLSCAASRHRVGPSSKVPGRHFASGRRQSGTSLIGRDLRCT
jgi:hypothetical protein